ncbi:hypothetical protein GP486_006539 [Trichoglossum hirsutum]|uniref:Uncharacterized protein n=1 Tax=Trichoglossum hirsutum TaxID=265104 RepID=A0A9P8L7C4_9PEZI|nr:hypothetical protein GP486_006539 [Trichoglossum hirsutum]
MAVLRGLVYLLVDQQPSLISHIRKKYDHAGRALFEDANAWVCRNLKLGSIRRDPPHSQPVFHYLSIFEEEAPEVVIYTNGLMKRYRLFGLAEGNAALASDGDFKTMVQGIVTGDRLSSMKPESQKKFMKNRAKLICTGGA